jgi:choline kinase
MKAVILAAGEGSRLRPLTQDRPKCLVELAGRSLLERQCAVLRRSGIRDVVVVAGYRAEQVRRTGVQVIVNPAYATTNMVASLFCARDTLLAGQDVLVCYGDIVFEERVIRALRSCPARVALAVNTDWLRLWRLRMADPLQDAETLRIARDGSVVEIGRKPRDLREIEAQYMGLIQFRADQLPEVVAFYDSLDRGQLYDGREFSAMFMTTFLQKLIDRGYRVQAVPQHGGWLEVDTLQDLALYEKLARTGRIAEYCELET